jgi:hypothetical protein
MLLIIAIVLLVLWFLGFLAFHVASAAIHILLALAIIMFIWHLVAGRRTRTV